MLRRWLFQQFGLVYRVSLWFSRHFSPLGHFLLGLLAVSAAFGANTRAAPAYELSSLLAGLFGLALLWAYLGRGAKLDLTVERRLASHATVGETLRYQITLLNQGKRTECGLSLLDRLHISLPDWDEFNNIPDQGRFPGNAVDRYVGFQRWQWLLRMKRGADIKEQPLPDLPPGRRITVELELNPLRRGRLRFTDLCIYRPEPFGLFRTQQLIPLPKFCCVLPRAYAVSPLPSVGGRSYQRGGVALTNAVGESEELMSLREFRHGDVPRNIHWRSSAKLGRWVVKEFQDEYFVRRALVLDTCCGSSRPAEFEAAVSVAASLAIGEPQRDGLLDLLFVEQQVQRFSAGRGQAESVSLLEVLAGVYPVDPGQFGQLSRQVVHDSSAFSSAVCVLLEWDRPRQSLVESLSASGLPVAVLLVREQAPNPWPGFNAAENRNGKALQRAGRAELFMRQIRPGSVAADLRWD